MLFRSPHRQNRKNTGGFSGGARRNQRALTWQTPQQQSVADVSREFNPTGRVLEVPKSPAPAWLEQTSQGYKPTLTEALGAIPFSSSLATLKPHDYGVIKFCGIPYSVTKNEILVAMGRQAQVVQMPAGTKFFAVHIIMDRNTGKTMDAFVEVSKPQEAALVADSFTRRLMSGRPLKIGDRAVDVELSSQEELMGNLFPRTKFTTWKGSVPKVNDAGDMYFPGQPARGFDGFVGSEEMVMLIKFANQPSRVSCPPFGTSHRCTDKNSLVSLRFSFAEPHLRVHHLNACEVPVVGSLRMHPFRPQEALQRYRELRAVSCLHSACRRCSSLRADAKPAQ